MAIVNESFATHFFDPIDVVERGFSVRGPGNRPILITGVVKDARDRGVKRPAPPVAYLPFGQREVRTVTFTVRAETAASPLWETVRRTVERVDPAVAVARMRTVDAQFHAVLRRERSLAALGAIFGRPP